ncbi:hypothetical protein TNCV_2430951 [Trichonephila clavipes]|nr:hypothetical protein TNCV_2430951 [Trichonephila clavipes]
MYRSVPMRTGSRVTTQTIEIVWRLQRYFTRRSTPIGGSPGSNPVSNLQASKFESGFKSSRQRTSLHGRSRVSKAKCFLFGSRSQTARFRACVAVIKH